MSENNSAPGSHAGPCPRLTGALPGGISVDYELSENQVVIGRAQECDLRLDHPGVSRRHARIRRDGSGWVIEDLHSANGVLLNGRKIQTAALADKDEADFGPIRLRFSLGQTGLPADDDKTVFRRVDAKPVKPDKSVDSVRPGLLSRVKNPGNRRMVWGILGVVLLLLFLLSLCGRDEPSPEVSREAAGEPRAPAEPLAPMPQGEPSPPLPLAPVQAPAPAASEPGQDHLHDAKALAAERAEAAQISFDAGRLPDAIEDWGLALELDPQNEVYRVKLETARQMLTDKAEEAYRNGARHYQFLRYDDAVREWNRVLYLIPDPEHPLHQKTVNNLEQAMLQKQR